MRGVLYSIINTTDWMDDVTKQKALQKVSWEINKDLLSDDCICTASYTHTKFEWTLTYWWNDMEMNQGRTWSLWKRNIPITLWQANTIKRANKHPLPKKKYSSVGRAVSRNLVTRVWNQVDALVPFGKALVLITRSLGEDIKPSAV